MSDAHVGLSNKWESILAGEGIDRDVLDGKQHPCPICEGKDRFRFDDKGEGLWYCNHCGSGDGFGLLMRKLGIDFLEAKRLVMDAMGTVEEKRPKPPLSDHRKREMMNEAWAKAEPGAARLRLYLAFRGIPDRLWSHPTLRWHPALYCSAHGKQSPAVLIKCYRWSIEGKPEPATIQRHWVELDTKMMMPAPIKLDGIFCPLGGRPVKGVLGVCEGYVTALSVMALQSPGASIPVWSCMSAEQLIKFNPPPDVHHLFIFIDVDKSFTGAAAGYALAKRLRITRPDLETVVCYPTYEQNVDYDFNDKLKGAVPCSSPKPAAPAAAAAIATASPASPCRDTPPPTERYRCAISAVRVTSGPIHSVTPDASTPAKLVAADSTVSLTEGVVGTAATIRK
jgi:putative DNA primase/helicase